VSTVSATTHTANVRRIRVPSLRRRWHWSLVFAVLAGLVGYAVTTIAAVGPWGGPVAGAATPSAERISEQLARTAAAEEQYYEAHERYTPDLAELGATGWVPVGDVSVVVVSAGAEVFCLAAGPSGEEPTAWLSQEWGAAGEPCE
jgi:hypothetical protein